MSTERVAAAAAARGVEIEVVEFPAGTRTAEDAATAIGVTVGEIVKSLVFTVDGRPTLALVSGSNRVETDKLATAAGGSVVERADAELVRAATGFAIGGVAPFGSTDPLPCYIDRDLLEYEVVWAAAGTPNAVFPIAPGDLVNAADAVVAAIAALA